MATINFYHLPHITQTHLNKDKDEQSSLSLHKSSNPIKQIRPLPLPHEVSKGG